MVTLYDVTQKTKILLKGLGIVIGGLIILSILINIGGFIKEALFPTPPPAPKMGFGKLPPVNFPQNSITRTLEFTINTVSGTLPEITDRISVYKIIQPSPNLLALQNSQAAVKNNGFEGPGVRLTENLYQWNDSSNFSRRLILNIFSYNFTLSSNYLNNETTLTQSPPSDKDSITTAQNFIGGITTFPTDIDMEKTTTKPYAISSSNIVPVDSIASGNIMKVDFFQTDIEEKDELAKVKVQKLPIFYPNPPASPMTLYISKDPFQAKGVAVYGSYFHQSISEESSTYPLKTIAEAFKELQDGQAYIASYFGSGSVVPINEVKLGYFMGDKEQPYLMPVYLFEGDNGFFGYVSAVANTQIGISQ